MSFNICYAVGNVINFYYAVSLRMNQTYQVLQVGLLLSLC